MSAPVAIRPARVDDLPAIHAIQTHYVLHTVLNFCYEPVSLAEIAADYEEVLSQGYPYFVAVPANDGGETDGGGSSSSSGSSDVRGYAYVHSFRSRAAYQYTGELSIFCRPDSTGGGMGKALLEACLAFLRESKERARAARHSSQGNTSISADSTARDTDERAFGRPKDIHQLLACMTVHPDKTLDDKLKRFYAREGFVETALQKQVGWKWGQWLDTRVMQLQL